MQNKTLDSFEILDVGRMRYGDCLALQHERHEAAVNSGRDSIIFVEHEPVITFGKNADPSYLHFGADYLKANGVELFHTDRGGEVTAHMPGQLVVYPILYLPKFNLGARDYVRALEETVIDVVARFGLEARTDDDFPGVWVGRNKICAVGVRIRSRACMHGIAFNVNNKFDLFDLMTPCGIQGRGVCSLSSLLGRDVSVEDVKELFLESFLEKIRRKLPQASLEQSPRMMASSENS